jgi:hypothetical protein
LQHVDILDAWVTHERISADAFAHKIVRPTCNLGTLCHEFEHAHNVCASHLLSALRTVPMHPADGTSHSGHVGTPEGNGLGGAGRNGPTHLIGQESRLQATMPQASAPGVSPRSLKQSFRDAT